MNKGALLLVLVLSMPIVSSLSTPITVPVIVKLGNDKAINVATETIVNKLGNDVIVVNFDSLWYCLVIWRSHRATIWISHGDSSGIKIEGSIISWKKFVEYFDLSPSIDIVLSCSSSVVNVLTGKGIGLGFGGLDAIIGGLLASAMIHPDMSILQEIYLRYKNIVEGKALPLLLSLSYAEGFYWISIIIVTILATLFNFYKSPQSSFIQKLVEATYKASIVGSLYTALLSLAYWSFGWISFNSLLAGLVTAVSNFISLAITVIPKIISWWDWLAWGAALVLTFIQFLSGSIAIKIAVVAAFWTCIGIGFWNDWNDPNPWVG